MLRMGMKKTEMKREGMKKAGMKKAAVCMCTAILAAGIAGTGNIAFGATHYESDKNQENERGRIFVDAGLEISIAYDKKGNVLEIKGLDRDGKEFLEGQDGYIGKSCKSALKRLVQRLDEKGWFDQNTSSSKPSLIIRSKRGSKYPDANFMKDIDKAVREVINRRELDIYFKVSGIQSPDDKGYLDKETLEKMIREQLGLRADSVKIKDCELDDGVYEIEVLINGVAYEVDLNAVTGTIVDIDRDDDDREDPFDQDDDLYGDDDDYHGGITPYNNAVYYENSRSHEDRDSNHGHNDRHSGYGHDDDRDENDD